MKGRYARVCPHCGSINIGLWATDAGTWNFCKDCDFGREFSTFGGSFPQIKFSELEAFRREMKNAKKIKK